MRILILQNLDAGHEPALPQPLVRKLQRAGHDVEWRSIKEQRVDDPAIGTFDLVVAAGGDGSVGRTARQLVGSQVPIAVMPLGTANNLASILDAGKHDLADRITEWTIVPFDAGTVEWAGERHWFFEGFGIGAFAETAAMLTALEKAGDSEDSREAELARDITALRDRSRDQPPFQSEVELDGKVVRARLVMLEVLNIGLLGPKVELAPGVDPSDGALDVVMVDEAHRGTLLEYFERRIAGRDAEAPFLSMRARHVQVKVAAPVCAHIDGKTENLPAGVITLGIHPHAVRFLGGTSG